MPLPLAVEAALNELESHYTGYEFNDRGGNGHLVFARNRILDKPVAIKFYCGEPGDKQHDEPRLLGSIASPHVLQILDAKNVTDGWAYFVTPRCNEGDLDDVIQSSPSAHKAIDIALGICQGVSAIHAQGIVHRDLKPGNIVIHESQPHIADFGSCRLLTPGESDTIASRHTVLYRPPESFDSGRYSTRGDVYQIGVLVYQLLGGFLAYKALDHLGPRELKRYWSMSDQFDRSKLVDSAIRNKVVRGALLQLDSLPPWISNSAKNLLRTLTHPNPDKRVGTVGEAAAEISKLRACFGDWAWVGSDARLILADRTIELRQVGHNLFEAFQRKALDFRRVPGLANAPLRSLIEQLGL